MKTKRLYLDLLSLDDLPALEALDGHPEVMKFIGEPRTKEVVKARYTPVIKAFPQNPGFGIWMARLKKTSEPIGWVCLKDLDGSKEIEVGYRLAFAHWGNGYATELASALVRYGFEDQGLEKIVGVCNPKNLASRRVLEKVGLKYRRRAHFYNSDVLYFSWTRRAWQKGQ